MYQWIRRPQPSLAAPANMQHFYTLRVGRVTATITPERVDVVGSKVWAWGFRLVGPSVGGRLACLDRRWFIGEPLSGAQDAAKMVAQRTDRALWEREIGRAYRKVRDARARARTI